MSIVNDGSGAGDITLDPDPFLGSQQYYDANLISLYVTVPQTLAVAAPEPGTLLLLGAGLGGLAAAVRARRQRV